LSEGLQMRAEEDLAALDNLGENLDEVILGLGTGSESRAGNKLDEIRHRLKTMRRLKAGQMESATSTGISMVQVSDDLPLDEAVPVPPDRISG
jgi:hypothetical protein